MFYKYVGCFIVGCLVGGYSYQHLSDTETTVQQSLSEQSDLCYDTHKYEAWVARKNGEARCFMEYKEYPHRVKASYID